MANLKIWKFWRSFVFCSMLSHFRGIESKLRNSKYSKFFGKFLKIKNGWSDVLKSLEIFQYLLNLGIRELSVSLSTILILKLENSKWRIQNGWPKILNFKFFVFIFNVGIRELLRSPSINLILKLENSKWRILNSRFGNLKLGNFSVFF